MNAGRDSLPDDVEALKAALVAERVEAGRIAAELAVARAKASDDQALIAHQQLEIAKLKRRTLWFARGAHIAASRSSGVAVRGGGEFGDGG
jgi:hypothetical protein